VVVVVVAVGAGAVLVVVVVVVGAGAVLAVPYSNAPMSSFPSLGRANAPLRTSIAPFGGSETGAGSGFGNACPDGLEGLFTPALINRDVDLRWTLRELTSTKPGSSLMIVPERPLGEVLPVGITLFCPTMI